MFKFLRELAAAVKEGAAEGLAEADQEIAAKKEAEAGRRRAQAAELERRLATASSLERLSTALAAPYREVFLSELEAATDAERPPVYLFCTDLPPDEVKSWRKLLKRDFDVGDAEDAEAIVQAFREEAETSSSPEDAALSLVRAAHVATGAAGVGLVPLGRALTWTAELAAVAAERFSSWDTLGEAFLAGERKAPGSNALGRKFLNGAVGRLRKDERSPWRKLPWPAAAEDLA